MGCTTTNIRTNIIMVNLKNIGGFIMFSKLDAPNCTCFIRYCYCCFLMEKENENWICQTSKYNVLCSLLEFKSMLKQNGRNGYRA